MSQAFFSRRSFLRRLRLLLSILPISLLVVACSDPPPPAEPLPPATYTGHYLPATTSFPASFSPCDRSHERWYLTDDTTLFSPDTSYIPSPRPQDTLQAYSLARDSIFSTIASLSSYREVKIQQGFSFPSPSRFQNRALDSLIQIQPSDSALTPIPISFQGYASNRAFIGGPPAYNRIFVVTGISEVPSSCSFIPFF